MNIKKANSRDKKKFKLQYGMQVENTSIFTLERQKVVKAKKIKNDKSKEE